ncbi:MAG: tetratricopeptide repeat protein [Candidatus Nanopelagicales bacterium]
MDYKALAALSDTDPDEAFRQANEHLTMFPDDVQALFVVGVVNARANRYSIALAVFERLTKLWPKKAECWNNYGMALTECGQYIEGRQAFKRALELSPKASYKGNISTTYISEGKYVEAKRWARRALEDEPDHAGARSSLGFAHLALGEWAEGWELYEACLGGRFRKELKFGPVDDPEPRWDGSHVNSLVVYGEQGMGDEIMYGSIIPEALQRADHVAIECDSRLEGLYKRSFPTAEVHGTRRAEAPWARRFDAGVACGSLASLFRKSQADCPRVPYLVADPERRLQWRALFDSWGKPVVGINWTGGRPATGKRFRSLGIEAFRPLIQSTDAVFVSLQYTDPTEEIEASGLPVRHFDWATLTPDYDDTAALVAELDYLVGIHSTVHHLAGSLGRPSLVLVPEKPMWNYATGSRMPWYAEQVFHRQRKSEAWIDCVKRINLAEALDPLRRAA